MNWFQVKAYIKHRFRKKQWRAGDFSSLVAAELAKYVIYNHHPYYSFQDVDDIRHDLQQAKQKLEVTDFGVGSKKFKTNERSIRHLIKYNATPKKQGEFIFRLVQYLKPCNIIELGTSLGIGTLYLALPNSLTQVFTIEGCPKISQIAQQNFSIAGALNIVQHIGSFQDELPMILASVDQVGMVYFDGHHAYQPTIDYFHLCLNKAKGKTVFVFDDIYWSKGMAMAWNEIIAHPSVSLSFDFFSFGVVVLNVPYVKEHYFITNI
ncbi:O-methyltransferase [Saccharicrinis fermentans]|uniref:Putative O-methyltransferase n=1 Tax=Saccharicrinis fermentans DSM 9555 = JCM 21142 TaxID=869213 RepID=W7YQN3_9BACT|nr:class I SAM-dependent methyltransferase [Saccharicrinis fermentans]GAF04734.1 putative O-methyltransferase [Saccharicrinis fermentans DSM 9555 = JCM 21142]